MQLLQLQLASRLAALGAGGRGAPGREHGWPAVLPGGCAPSHGASVLCCLLSVPKCHCHQEQCDQAVRSHAMIRPLAGKA